jgi:hypothetical protein
VLLDFFISTGSPVCCHTEVTLYCLGTGILVLSFPPQIIWPLKTRGLSCLETSDTNHTVTRRHMTTKPSYLYNTTTHFPTEISRAIQQSVSGAHNAVRSLFYCISSRLATPGERRFNACRQLSVLSGTQWPKLFSKCGDDFFEWSNFCWPHIKWTNIYLA